MPFNKKATKSLVELVGLSPGCQQFFNHWLQAFEGNALPSLKSFRAGALRKLEPFIITYDFRPGKSAMVASMGRKLSRILGGDYAGQDWLKFGSPPFRSERLRGLAAVARGALLRTNRQLKLDADTVHHFETLIVPLQPEEERVPLISFVDLQLPRGTRVISPDELGGAPSIAEFIPIMVNDLKEPQTQIVGKELKRDEKVKIISRAATRFMLNYMGDVMSTVEEAGLDIVDYLIATAVGSANVSHIDNDASLSREYAGLIEPDWMRRGISRAAIARATSIPLETVRRRVNGLIKSGVLAEREDGVILSATNRFKIGARLDRMHASAHLVERMVRDMKLRGVSMA